MDAIRGNVNLVAAALRSSALVLRILPALGLDGLAAEGTFVRLAIVLEDLHGQRVPHVLDPGLDGDDVDVVVLCDILINISPSNIYVIEQSEELTSRNILYPLKCSGCPKNQAACM